MLRPVHPLFCKRKPEPLARLLSVCVCFGIKYTPTLVITPDSVLKLHWTWIGCMGLANSLRLAELLQVTPSLPHRPGVTCAYQTVPNGPRGLA